MYTAPSTSYSPKPLHRMLLVEEHRCSLRLLTLCCFKWIRSSKCGERGTRRRSPRVDISASVAWWLQFSTSHSGILNPSSTQTSGRGDPRKRFSHVKALRILSLAKTRKHMKWRTDSEYSHQSWAWVKKPSLSPCLSLFRDKALSEISSGGVPPKIGRSFYCWLLWLRKVGRLFHVFCSDESLPGRVSRALAWGRAAALFYAALTAVDVFVHLILTFR